VQFYSGWDFYVHAWKALKNKTANMDTLIALGSSAAYFYSVALMAFGLAGHVYFETAALIITLILVGKYLEVRAKSQTSAAIKTLMGLQAKTARVLRGSEHPLGEAIVRAAQERNLDLAQPQGFEAIAGHGIAAQLNGRAVLLGNLKLLRDRGVELNGVQPDVERLQGEGKTAMVGAADGEALGVVAVADTVKPTSQAAVAELHRLGIQVAMLTGDNQRTASAIARPAMASTTRQRWRRPMSVSRLAPGRMWRWRPPTSR
jgi:cation transport ATPase